jgi:hypothetical protein
MKKALEAIGVLLVGLVVLPAVMAGSDEWSWREGRIDILDAYVVLLYGPADADPSRWTAVARVGPPRGREFPVQWLVSREAEETRGAVEAVVNDLDSYLRAGSESDPWSFVLGLCRTASNWEEGHVHWMCVSRVSQPARPRPAEAGGGR